MVGGKGGGGGGSDHLSLSTMYFFHNVGICFLLVYATLQMHLKKHIDTKKITLIHFLTTILSQISAIHLNVHISVSIQWGEMIHTE